MIDVLVIRLRVEYFLFGDRQIRELMFSRHSLTALVRPYARRSGTFNVLFNYCIHSRDEYNKYIGVMLLVIRGAEFYVVVCP